ncbi:MAG: DUF4387 family protein [Acidimicrobiia bacterium]
MSEVLQRAVVVRTKNAGPFHLTIDLFFADRADFDAARASGELEAAAVARCYGVPVDQVEGPFWETTALGVKVTIPKRPSSAEPGCSDILGGHLHVPLLLGLDAP